LHEKENKKNQMTDQQIIRQAEMLSNRVKKRFVYLYKKFKKQNIDAFRLYDWDIPEIRAVVDWYAGHIVIAEYTRLQSMPQWLPAMAESVAAVLNVLPENVHLKQRHTATENEPRYKRIAKKETQIIVRERDLKFRVNLSDYVDTGLFSDHRDTREFVRKLARGKDFLNLYCYTGSFTCYAASGGANTTVSVDRSADYIQWSQQNLQLNGLWSGKHSLIQADAMDFLERLKRSGKLFSLAVVDPPSFSRNRVKGTVSDIQKDHPEILKRTLNVMKSRGIVFFSTNHQRFEPHMDDLEAEQIEEITEATIPEDYRNRKIHRCWKITAF
jgi:23S rRNA G2069 N7-methylase RlmK/C1962 C5-methylase RlmI